VRAAYADPAAATLLGVDLDTMLGMFRCDASTVTFRAAEEFAFGVLAAVAIPAFTRYVERAREAEGAP